MCAPFEHFLINQKSVETLSIDTELTVTHTQIHTHTNVHKIRTKISMRFNKDQNVNTH